MSDLKGASILITGGTGSFGKKFTDVLLKEYSPKKLIIFSRDELKQHDMKNDGFDAPCMRYFIGDVRDRNRLRRAMSGVDIVVHAAALKHVPACEYNPIEAVKTNIGGAENIVEAAVDAGVEKVLALSTDKAVNPVNLYGATKLVAEKVFTQGNSYAGSQNTRFSCVRYGNVVGSRGSVIPVFEKQRKTGTINITDDRMTRFWITLEQGVRFVIHCIENMKGGEVFVPKIPSMKITDLAEVVAPECKQNIIGIRPGEKLHESMLSEDEARHTVETEDGFIIQPEDSLWTREKWPEANVPDGFRYSSDTNTQWLTHEQLKEFIS
ncbi:MAG: UDP-N-acetylglucosamine 4,6-dehydratase (inverting) [Candidatus Peribacteraceae bacterium]|nr:UDP-N-acetylglucosamine 4,6-dehydratase (inverting) [Candidatus Peribacteraceae bacterium]